MNSIVNKILRKPVVLIQCSKSLTLLQHKISNILLYKAQDELNKETHMIRLDYICGCLGYKGRNNYGRLQLATESLVGVDGGLLRSAFFLNGVCEYEYTQPIKELIKEQLLGKPRFAKIDLDEEMKLKSKYSLMLYEYCVRYINIGKTNALTLEEFREMLGLENNEYWRDIKNLNRKIIKKSAKEIIKLSDINVYPHFKKNEYGQMAQLSFTVWSKKRVILEDNR